MSFTIQLDPATFETRKTSFTGEIWVRSDERDFPGAGWNDFVVVILGWWLEAARALVSGEQATGNFRFMDGPWFFEIASTPDGPWTIRLVDDHGDRGQPIHSSTLWSHELVEALLGAAATVERYCVDHGWSSDDLELLARRRAALRSCTRTRA